MTQLGEQPRVGPEASYIPLDAATESDMVAHILSENPRIPVLDLGKNQYAMVTISGVSPYSNLARTTESELFADYFGNTPPDMHNEYYLYESQSTFFVVVDPWALHVAGVMRIIKPGSNGLKSANDLPSDKCQTDQGEAVTDWTTDHIYEVLGINPRRTLDVATIAVRPRYGEKVTRNPVVLAALMRAVHRYTAAAGYDDLIAIIDTVPLSKLIDVGLPVADIPEIKTPFRYLGAENNHFMHIPMADVNASVRAKDPMKFEYVFGNRPGIALGGQCQLSFIEQ